MPISVRSDEGALSLLRAIFSPDRRLWACPTDRKRGAASTLTLRQRRFERRIGEATYPNEDLHIHHVVPLSKGGNHSWGNIAFIPASLNDRIGAKLPKEVYRQLALVGVTV